MKKRLPQGNQRGQGLSEFILSIPILFLFAAAAIQFSILFLAYVQFDHACGEAARLYAAGLIDPADMEPSIFDQLGPFQGLFPRRLLHAKVQPPRFRPSGALEKLRSAAEGIPFSIQYEGAEWNIQCSCFPPLWFHPLFKDGILFHTTLQVYRYFP